MAVTKGIPIPESAYLDLKKENAKLLERHPYQYRVERRRNDVLERENAKLKEAIQEHKDSFTDPEDHTEEDLKLWEALEGLEE